MLRLVSDIYPMLIYSWRKLEKNTCLIIRLLDKLAVAGLVRKSSPFCGARKSVTFLTRAPYLSIYWAVLIQCKSSSIIYLIFVSILSAHLRLAISVGPVLSLSPNAVSYAFPKTSCRPHYSNPPLFSHMFTLRMFLYVDKAVDLKSCLCYQVWLLNNEATRTVHVLRSWLPKYTNNSQCRTFTQLHAKPRTVTFT